MDRKLEKLLEMTHDVHLPIPIDENETAEKRLLEKPVIESRLIDDMETLDHFEKITPWIQLEVSSDRFVSGSHSIKMTCPTNLDSWDTERGHGPGRIYDIPSAYRRIDNEDWTDWNRLSFWVYPDCKGMKSLSFRVQIHNDGEHKVPDIYDREGGHNINLKPDCWNHIVYEFPYLARDKVVGVSFDYDMVGHEPEAVDHCVWYLDKLELQKVKCDVYEGWIPAEDRISYCHSGYQTGSKKVAIASGIDAKTFKLIELETGRVVLEKEIATIEGKIGTLQVMDFSEVMEQGNYIIVAGNLSTRAFAIGDDVWESSIWKVLNFFLVLRCGYEVYGKHRACHTDMLLKHGDKAIVANGGWHDAGDLAQSLNNTSEATQALFCLALELKGKNDRLYQRVLEEAKWGLDYVLKTRFGDGYRASYSSCSIWTDGIIGTNDDVSTAAVRSAYTNFDAAYAELLGAKALADVDPDYARYAIKIAKEDFAFGKEILEENKKSGKTIGTHHVQFIRGDIVDPQVHSIAALAATELYQLTKEEEYKSLAHEYARVVIACQQREYTDWDVPMIGFYYEDLEKTLIWHHNHMSYAYLPDLAMKTLCEAFPDSSDYMLWYSALALSGKYYCDIAKYTMPYGVIPSGVYHVDEAKDGSTRLLSNHPLMQQRGTEEIQKGYRALVEKGFPLGKGYYLRVYPVWFSFRGNYNVMLSDGKAALSVAKITNNYELAQIPQRQFEWTVGKNPMAQSTMYGEGYDYVQLYAVQPGQTVGAISVGMQSNGINDEPFWPHTNNATYKEVWVCSATKWMWNMADSHLPATVSGYLAVEGIDPIVFTHKKTGKEYTAAVHPRTGWFTITLPSGEYTAKYANSIKNITVISGKDYTIDGKLYDLSATCEQNGEQVTIQITLQGEYDMPYELRAYNLKGFEPKGIIKVNNNKGTVTVTAQIENMAEPFSAIVIPCGDIANKVEVKH